MHILRVNHQALIWRQAEISQTTIPNQEDHGWKRDDDAMLSIEGWKEWFLIHSMTFFQELKATNSRTVTKMRSVKKTAI